MSTISTNPHDYRYSFSGSDCKAYAYFPNVKGLEKFIKDRVGEFDKYADKLKNGLTKHEERLKKIKEKKDEAVEKGKEAKRLEDQAEAAGAIEEGSGKDGEVTEELKETLTEAKKAEEAYAKHAAEQAKNIVDNKATSDFDGQVLETADGGGFNEVKSFNTSAAQPLSTGFIPGLPEVPGNEDGYRAGRGNVRLNEGLTSNYEAYTDLPSGKVANAKGEFGFAQSNYQSAGEVGGAYSIPNENKVNSAINSNQNFSQIKESGKLYRDAPSAPPFDPESSSLADKAAAQAHWQAESAAANQRLEAVNSALGTTTEVDEQLDGIKEGTEELKERKTKEGKEKREEERKAKKSAEQLEARFAERYKPDYLRKKAEIERVEKVKDSLVELAANYSQQDWVLLDSMQTISISINEAKAPARRLGHRNITGMSRSSRTIAGTIIMTVIDNHPLAKLMLLDPQQIVKGFKNKTEQFKWHRDESLGRAGHESTPDPLGRHWTRTATDLAPFNLFLEYASEYPGMHLARDQRIIQGQAEHVNRLNKRLNEINSLLQKWGFSKMPIPREGESKAAFDERKKKWKKSQEAASARLVKYDARTGEGGGRVPQEEADENSLGMKSAKEHGPGMAYERGKARRAYVEDKSSGLNDSKIKAYEELVKEAEELHKDIQDVKGRNSEGKSPLGKLGAEGGLPSRLVNPVKLQLEGIELLHEGVVTSTNDMVTEITFQFIARDYYELFLDSNDPMGMLLPNLSDVLAEFAHTEEINLGIDLEGKLTSHFKPMSSMHPLFGTVQTSFDVAPDMEGFEQTATSLGLGNQADSGLQFPDADIMDELEIHGMTTLEEPNLGDSLYKGPEFSTGANLDLGPVPKEGESNEDFSKRQAEWNQMMAPSWQQPGNPNFDPSTLDVDLKVDETFSNINYGNPGAANTFSPPSNVSLSGNNQNSSPYSLLDKPLSLTNPAGGGNSNE